MTNLKHKILSALSLCVFASSCSENSERPVASVDELLTPALSLVEPHNWDEDLGTPATLIEQLPEDVLGYIRIPSLWGIVGTPKGNNLTSALSTEANQYELEQLQEQLGEQLKGLLPPAANPIVETMLQRLRSPLEMVFLRPLSNNPEDVTVVLSGRVNFTTLELFNVFLMEATGQNQDIVVLPDASNSGSGIMAMGPLTVQYDYDFSNNRLTALVGAQADRAQLDAVLSWPAANPDSSVHNLENRIDSSGHGLFAWINIEALLPLLQESISLDEFASLGGPEFFGLSSLAIGEGVANGKGRLSIIANGDGSSLFNSTLPALAPPDISLRGEPLIVATLRIPSQSWIERVITENASVLGITENDEIASGDYSSLYAESPNIDIERLMAGLAGHVSYIEDAAGRYIVFSPENSGAFEPMLLNLVSAGLLEIQNVQINNINVRELRFSFPLEDSAPEIIQRIRSRLYLMREGNHFLVAQMPQIMRSRSQISEERSLTEFISTNYSAADRSILSIAGRNHNVASKNYYNYLTFLQTLGDLANHEVDIASFPTAGELNLPADSNMAFQLNYAEDEIALQLIYDSHPIELIAGKSSMAVATMGVLAAVALPAYQNYSDRAAFSELVLSVTPSKTVIDLALANDEVTSLNQLDEGSFRIPIGNPATSTSHGLSVVDGVITATWRDDGSNLAGVTYVLFLQVDGGSVGWYEGGTCLSLGYC